MISRISTWDSWAGTGCFIARRALIAESFHKVSQTLIQITPGREGHRFKEIFIGVSRVYLAMMASCPYNISISYSQPNLRRALIDDERLPA